MRAIFVSLVVLLVAVCRLSTGELVSWSAVDMYALQNRGNNSLFSLAPHIKAEQYSKFVLGNRTRFQFYNLNLRLGNTIYAMILDQLGLYESLPSYYKNALDNGVLCEVNEGLRDGAIKDTQYDAEFLSTEQRAAELQAAKAIGIDCGGKSDSEAVNGFCNQHYSLLYSAALKFRKRIEKSVARKTCENDLIGSIMRGPWTSPASYIGFYLDDHANEIFVRSLNSFDGIPKSNLGDHLRKPGHYCLASYPEAETAVKTLFAANALRWTLEGYILQQVFNGAHADIGSACSVEKFETSDVGKCACSKETGLSFCIDKVRAEYYKKIGFLTCDEGSMRFNWSSKPASITPFVCLSDSVAAATAPECESYRNSMQ